MFQSVLFSVANAITAKLSEEKWIFQLKVEDLKKLTGKNWNITNKSLEDESMLTLKIILIVSTLSPPSYSQSSLIQFMISRALFFLNHFSEYLRYLGNLIFLSHESSKSNEKITIVISIYWLILMRMRHKVASSCFTQKKWTQSNKFLKRNVMIRRELFSCLEWFK